MTETREKKRGFFGRLFGRDTPVEPEPHEKAGPLAKPEAARDTAVAPPPEVVPEAKHAREAATEPPREADAVHEVRPEGEAGRAATADASPSADPPAQATEVVASPVAPAVVAPTAVAAAAEPAAAEPAPRQTWFQKLRSGLAKTSSRLTDGITSIFTKRRLDAATLEDLEDLLIQSDLGVETAMRITEAISKGRFEKGISADEVKAILAEEVERVLKPVAIPLAIDRTKKPHVVLVVGVNGTGKTTTIGKLADRFRRDGLKVMLAAGDTFRAAAIDQLKIWGERTGAPVIARSVGADASGLAFDALQAAKDQGADVLLLDTAGRLQNKQVLMEELQKVIRVLRKIDPSAPHDCLLVLDATTGQNAMSQVEVFREKAGVTGLVMTKLDGTARGGILVAIAAKHQIPVHAVGVGESVEDLQPFDPGEFARAIAAN